MIASIDSTSKAFSFVIILSTCTGYAPEGPPGARFSLFTFHQSPITSSRSAPGVTRTLDLRIRNPLLYPAELRAQFIGKSKWQKRFCCSFTVLFCGRPCETAQTHENMEKNANAKSYPPQIRELLCQSFRRRQRGLEVS